MAFSQTWPGAGMSRGFFMNVQSFQAVLATHVAFSWPDSWFMRIAIIRFIVAFNAGSQSRNAYPLKP